MNLRTEEQQGAHYVYRDDTHIGAIVKFAKGWAFVPSDWTDNDPPARRYHVRWEDAIQDARGSSS